MRLTTKLSEMFQSISSQLAWVVTSCSCWEAAERLLSFTRAEFYQSSLEFIGLNSESCLTPIIICPSSLSTERVRQRKKTPRLQADNVKHCPKWQCKHKGKKENSSDVESDPSSEHSTGGTGSTLQTTFSTCMSRCRLTTHEQLENGKCEVNQH